MNGGRPEPRAVFADTEPVCGHWVGADRRHCHTTEQLRPYVVGWRCPAHTPAAVAGRPEPQPGPGWPTAAWTTPSPDSASRVHDARAIASGKRRSHHHAEYRAAQAAVGSRKDTTA